MGEELERLKREEAQAIANHVQAMAAVDTFLPEPPFDASEDARRNALLAQQESAALWRLAARGAVERHRVDHGCE